MKRGRQIISKVNGKMTSQLFLAVIDQIMNFPEEDKEAETKLVSFT